MRTNIACNCGVGFVAGLGVLSENGVICCTSRRNCSTVAARKRHYDLARP